MNSGVRKNLVIGFATNQKIENVTAFCKSIRSLYTKYECDVVLAVNQPEVFELCVDMDVIPVLTLSKYKREQKLLERLLKQLLFNILSPLRRFEDISPPIASIPALVFETLLHPHLGRWFFYNRVFEAVRPSGKVVICDVADVFFQDHFFNLFQDEALLLFRESGFYGSSQFNDGAYRKLYGERELKKILGQTPICLGVLGGGAFPVRNLIKWMLNSAYSRPNGGSDQVRGNRYAHSGGVLDRIDVFDNGEGAVLHIDRESVISSIEAGIGNIEGDFIVSRREGKLIPIVHMYNRSPDALAAVSRRSVVLDVLANRERV
jgi:hypothetical protein